MVDREWTIRSRSRLLKMGHRDPSRPCLDGNASNWTT